MNRSLHKWEVAREKSAEARDSAPESLGVRRRTPQSLGQLWLLILNSGCTVEGSQEGGKAAGWHSAHVGNSGYGGDHGDTTLAKAKASVAQGVWTGKGRLGLRLARDGKEGALQVEGLG